jgi:protein disulfide-isomerase
MKREIKTVLFSTMRIALCIGLLCGVGFSQEPAPEKKETEASSSAIEGWTENYQAALAAAKSENRNLLLLFTGSDWCGYCKALEKEVFSNSKFKNWAKTNVILVKIDFPRSTKKKESIKTQNELLKTKYHQGVYPTVYLISPDERVLKKEIGYDPGSGPVEYLKKIADQDGDKNSEKKTE